MRYTVSLVVGLFITVLLGVGNSEAQYSYSCRSVERSIPKIQRSIDRLNELSYRQSSKYNESVAKTYANFQTRVSQLVVNRENALFSCERRLVNSTYNNFFCISCHIKARIRYEICRDNAYNRADIRYDGIVRSYNSKVTSLERSYIIKQQLAANKLNREQARLSAANSALARCQQCNYQC